MDHAGEVDADLGVEQRRPDRAAGVDDDEHRRGEDVVVAGLASGLGVVVAGVLLAHRGGELAHLLAPHGVAHGFVGLAHRIGFQSQAFLLFAGLWTLPSH